MAVTFNPGPSQLSEDTVRHIAEIASSGLLAESHRGERVRGMVLRTVAAMRAAMGIPDDYAIVFQPSATAAMELIARNCVLERSWHFVNGAFAERFAKTVEQTGRSYTGIPTHGAPTGWPSVEIPPEIDLVAVTHNETSTGMMWPGEDLAEVRGRHPDALLAVDVTSSFGAMAMDWAVADLWFGSVQKCLGLPAGLGFVLAGPRAVERARTSGRRRGVTAWQDLVELARRMEAGETVETPNVLALALLGRQMARWDLAEVEAGTRTRARMVWSAPLEARFHVEDPRWRSLTVHNLVVSDPGAWCAAAAEAGFLLGRGYGGLRDTCVRIANFPAHGADDLATLLNALARTGA